jgi:hypothetical protein
VDQRHADLVQVVRVAAEAPAAGDAGAGTVVLDPELALHHRYGAEEECLYLIRPDGYVGYRSQPADRAALAGYLARLFR